MLDLSGHVGLLRFDPSFPGSNAHRIGETPEFARGKTLNGVSTLAGERAFV
jgi:hypothetical protein